MVHGVETLVGLAPLEERKIGHPQKIVTPLRNEPVFTAEVDSECAERREDHAFCATHRE